MKRYPKKCHFQIFFKFVEIKSEKHFATSMPATNLFLMLPLRLGSPRHFKEQWKYYKRIKKSLLRANVDWSIFFHRLQKEIYRNLVTKTFCVCFGILGGCVGVSGCVWGVDVCVWGVCVCEGGCWKCLYKSHSAHHISCTLIKSIDQFHRLFCYWKRKLHTSPWQLQLIAQNKVKWSFYGPRVHVTEGFLSIHEHTFCSFCADVSQCQ